jgi:hypothetical protein
MFAMQYEHRLPADYDMQKMRDRAATRGPQWDATPGLVFKAFVARERGQYGASANLYGAVYLWQDAASATRLLTGDGFRVVTDSFGRPMVETWLPLDARAGRATSRARALYRRSEALEVNADIPAVREAAIARNQVVAADDDDVLAAWVVLDVSSWALVWFTLSAAAPDQARGDGVYQVLFLAGPGLGVLPQAVDAESVPA